MKKNGFFVLVVLMVIILVSFLIVNEKKKESSKNQNLIGGDKDEGGCLIGAGYSWCPSKQKCLRIWEEACDDESKR